MEVLFHPTDQYVTSVAQEGPNALFARPSTWTTRVIVIYVKPLAIPRWLIAKSALTFLLNKKVFVLGKRDAPYTLEVGIDTCPTDAVVTKVLLLLLWVFVWHMSSDKNERGSVSALPHSGPR